MYPARLHTRRGAVARSAAARNAPKYGLIARPGRALAITAQAQQAEAGKTESASDSNTTEIYIGFVKEEGFGDRSGKKGRIVKDDPRKYPDRSEITGGWAGGEAGLWKLREEIAATQKKGKAAPATYPAPKEKPAGGKELIYVGYGKEPEDFAARAAGVKGKVIVDDVRKYPGREEVGGIPLTGGFAGGEAGLQAFVQTGEVPVTEPGQPKKSSNTQFQPLTIAGLLVLAGAGGGLLLTDLADIGEKVVRDDLVGAGVDDKTKTMLVAAIVVLAGVGVVAGARAAMSSMQERMQESAKNLILTAIFSLAVFVAARLVLES